MMIIYGSFNGSGSSGLQPCHFHVGVGWRRERGKVGLAVSGAGVQVEGRQETQVHSL